ncbi:MAG: hypothetical protein H6679_05465 [Epsilonproteobacteria bacterium]|nr:hypothetical protein [Campylobacterota bacterium]
MQHQESEILSSMYGVGLVTVDEVAQLRGMFRAHKKIAQAYDDAVADYVALSAEKGLALILALLDRFRP